MLVLTRNLTPGEVRTCKLSRKMIVYGDFYYQDTEDPKLYIKATEYHKLKKQEKINAFDYSKLEQAQSEKEYRQYMIQAQQEYLTATILSKEICINGEIENTEL
jgi:hypothetical protein